MENKVLFLDPLDIRPHFKRGTEGLIGASILGGTGLMSGILGSSSASSNNARMLEYNRWAQKDAQAYNTQMYERQLADQESMYNKYQSPQAIAQQLKAAGINPSALAAGQGFSGGSMPSVPAAGSSPVSSAPTLQNTGTPIGEGLQAAAGAIANLSQANESNASAQATIGKLSHEVNLMLAKQGETEVLTRQINLQNDLTQKYGDKKWSAEIGHLCSLAYANYCQGDLAEAEANYKDVLRQLSNFELDMNNETRDYLLGQVQQQYLLLKAKVDTEKSMPGFYGASTSNQKEQARLNKEQADYQKFMNSVYNKPSVRQSLLSEITSNANIAYKKNLISEKQLEFLNEQVELAKKENDTYKLQLYMSLINETIRSFGSAAGEIGRTMMAAKFMRAPAGSSIITNSPGMVTLPNGQVVGTTFGTVQW